MLLPNLTMRSTQWLRMSWNRHSNEAQQQLPLETTPVIPFRQLNLSKLRRQSFRLKTFIQICPPNIFSELAKAYGCLLD